MITGCLLKLMNEKYRITMNRYTDNVKRGRNDIANEDLVRAMAYHEVIYMLTDFDYFSEVYEIYFPAENVLEIYPNAD